MALPTANKEPPEVEGMSTWHAVLLGVLQGLTEFLPVSSSGHLVLAQHFLDVAAPGLTLEVLVHLGTLVAVVAVFWPQLIALLTGAVGLRGAEEVRTQRRLLRNLLIGTVPAAIFGILGADLLAVAFDSPRLTAWALVVTGCVLFASRRTRQRTCLGEMDAWEALGIGVAQAFALVPGLSRSGLTIAAGMALGLSGRDAARFSFLLAIPAISGACLLDVLRLEGNLVPGALWAVASAAVAGYLAIRWLLVVVRSRGLRPFAWYCWVVAAVALFALR